MIERSPLPPVSANAPGKLILTGEYAVLDGAPAICMAVARRACVRIAAADGEDHTVTAPGFSDVIGRFRVRNGTREWLAGAEEFRLVDEVWRTADLADVAPLSLVLDSSEFLDPDSGAKLGIGSSAAMAVALAAAFCELFEAGVDATRIASAAHRQFQGGFGSGADVACCAQGGVIEYRMGGGPAAARAWPDGLHYALLWSGVMASTGAKLRHLHGLDSRPTRAALGETAERVAAGWRAGDPDEILKDVQDYTAALREFDVDHQLGIFDAGHSDLTAVAAGAGLVYKPCGAGGGDMGIVLAADAAAINDFVSAGLPGGFRATDMRIDPCGMRVVREEH
jgi:phosphomevalonate kinase